MGSQMGLISPQTKPPLTDFMGTKMSQRYSQGEALSRFS